MKEEWRDIKGYEGKYQVSNTGKVKSLPRTTISKSRWGTMQTTYRQGGMLTFWVDKDGYKLVNLFDGKCTKHLRVHRLVAEAFIPHSKMRTIVNHKNGRKDDNRVSNLEWSTTEENSWHATHILKAFDGQNSRMVNQYSLDGKIAKTYPSLRAAGKAVGCSGSSIGMCCKGHTLTSMGYVWRYTSDTPPTQEQLDCIQRIKQEGLYKKIQLRKKVATIANELHNKDGYILSHAMIIAWQQVLNNNENNTEQ